MEPALPLVQCTHLPLNQFLNKNLICVYVCTSTNATKFVVAVKILEILNSHELNIAFIIIYVAKCMFYIAKCKLRYHRTYLSLKSYCNKQEWAMDVFSCRSGT